MDIKDNGYIELKVKKTSIHTIRHLHLYWPVVDSLEKTMTQEDHDKFAIKEYFHFPILINSDKNQWDHGCRYLLYLIKRPEYDLPKPSTLYSIAKDLRDFKNFCSEEGMDYLKVASKLRAPTRKYRSYLQDKFNSQELAANSLRRRMNNVVRFYEWLIKNESIKFNTPLWEEKNSTISFKDHLGTPHIKAVIQKDVAIIRKTTNTDTYDGTIQDGGRLKPLTIEEQKAIFTALKKIGNVEMELAFSIAIATGARLQTVFTLRCGHFEEILSDTENAKIIPVGNGTNCDTKYDKRYQLYMPAWVYHKIQVYIQSDQFIRRQKNSEHLFEHSADNYIFLTKSKKPYYLAKNDPNSNKLRQPITGGAIRVFIKNTLLPALREMGEHFTFQFHDLRATFGMNLVSFYDEKIADKSVSYLYVIDLVSKRMGHTSKLTTEKYLQYKQRNALAIQAQGKWEDYCQKIIEDSFK